MGLGEIHHPGPGFMPFYVGIILLIISFSLLARYLLQKGYRAKTGEEQKDARNVTKIVIAIASLVAYGVFLERLGFLVATFLLVGILFRTAGVKRYHFIVLGTILTVVISYILFTSLGLKFPKGVFDWG